MSLDVAKPAITADSNLLIRLAVQDDPAQVRFATSAMLEASRIVIPVPALCELVWVLRRLYKFSAAEVATAIRQLAGSINVEVDRPSVAAGLTALDAGGDFADAVIAHQGRLMGGTVFTSFDRRATSLLSAQGFQARLLS